MFVLRREANAAAKDQRVRGIALIVEDRSVHGRDTDLVAVILHARDDS